MDSFVDPLEYAGRRMSIESAACKAKYEALLLPEAVSHGGSLRRRDGLRLLWLVHYRPLGAAGPEAPEDRTAFERRRGRRRLNCSERAGLRVAGIKASSSGRRGPAEQA